MAFGFRKTATAVIKSGRQVDGWMDGRTDGQTDRQIGGWIDIFIFLSYAVTKKMTSFIYIKFDFNFSLAHTSCISSAFASSHVLNFTGLRGGWDYQNVCQDVQDQLYLTIEKRGHKLLNSLETHLPRCSEDYIWQMVLNPNLFTTVVF